MALVFFQFLPTDANVLPDMGSNLVEIVGASSVIYVCFAAC